MIDRYAITVIVAAWFAVTAYAGEVYKCPTAGGKVEYRDAPCPAGKKLDTGYNTVAPTPPSAEVAKAQAEIDAREAQRARVRAANADAARRLGEYCRDQMEQIARQRAWLRSESAAVRSSAQTEIELASARMINAGCR